MVASVQPKCREYQLRQDVAYAWQSTKEKVATLLSRFSLKDLCYGVGVVLSVLCVIHARKGKMVTAVALSVVTELAIYLGGRAGADKKPLIADVRVKESVGAQEEIARETTVALQSLGEGRVETLNVAETKKETQLPMAVREKALRSASSTVVILKGEGLELEKEASSEGEARLVNGESSQEEGGARMSEEASPSAKEGIVLWNASSGSSSESVQEIRHTVEISIASDPFPEETSRAKSWSVFALMVALLSIGLKR